MIEVLNVIDKCLESIGINYEFGSWTSDVKYPYFVGEYEEEEPTSEDGFTESIFILNGFSRNDWLALEKAKQKIKKLFNTISGKIVTTETNAVVAIFYTNSTPVPTGDEELKKVEIRLKIKKWSVV